MPSSSTATSGHVHLRPMADHRRSYEEKVRFRARRQEQFRALRAVEPVTKDGQRISLMMNAGLLVDLPQLAESGAEGIGLFRTELQFMIASTMPKAEEQEAVLPQRAEAGGGPAGHLPHARYRRRQGRALFPRP
jgi:phosphotransferase system enzyme I (PtsP)